MLDDARALHERGFSVIPIKPRDKTPAAKWKQFQEQRATAEQIEDWWNRNPEYNIGIVTGIVSGIFVLDQDGEDGAAELKYRDMPETVTAMTGKGAHFYFRHPGPHIVVKNQARVLPGIDIRGDGGYVVAPPSRHPSGVDYYWMISPEDAEIAEAPEWLLEILDTEKRPQRQSLESGVIESADDDEEIIGAPTVKADGGKEWFLADLEDGIKDGKRNSELARLTGRWCSMFRTQEELLAAVLAINQTKCQPPLPVDEVKRIVESISSRELAKQIAEGQQIVGDARVDVGNPDRVREATLEGLSTVFGVRITAVQRFLTTPPTFVMKTECGRVEIGNAANLLSYDRFKHIFAATTLKVPKVPRKEWDRHAQHILNACVDVAITRDATNIGGMADTVNDYLRREKPASGVHWAEAAISYKPFMLNGEFYISCRGMCFYLKTTQYETVTPAQLAVLLHGFGARKTTLRIVANGGKFHTTRECYRLPKAKLSIEMDDDDDAPFIDDFDEAGDEEPTIGKAGR